MTLSPLEQAKRISLTSSTPQFGLTQVYLAKGDYDQAMRHFLKESEASRNSLVNLAVLTSIYAARHDDEKALATLRKALDAGYRDFAALDSSPYLEKLQNDPRYQQLIHKYRE